MTARVETLLSKLVKEKIGKYPMFCAQAILHQSNNGFIPLFLQK
jgi:hypothetical protein